jgi:hypothetical protein
MTHRGKYSFNTFTMCITLLRVHTQHACDQFRIAQAPTTPDTTRHTGTCFLLDMVPQGPISCTWELGPSWISGGCWRPNSGGNPTRSKPMSSGLITTHRTQDTVVISCGGCSLELIIYMYMYRQFVCIR